MTEEEIFAALLSARGLTDSEDFLKPSYESLADPFLMPDMQKAVVRIHEAIAAGETIAVYGDYDIDGLTATTILSEALQVFGAHVETFIPDRFIDGYGMSVRGVDELYDKGVRLLITVDTGSMSHDHIAYAHKKGVDVIVTDHHTTGDTLPDAIAIINPKRSDSKYPYKDLAGVGVAFTLIRALQTVMEGLPEGQEKWFLDLVSMGTVCDVVPLTGENRTLVYWGLQVLKNTRRPGLHALAEVSQSDLASASPETYGFRFGPRLNASGRLDTARTSLDLLASSSAPSARVLAQKLDEQNTERRRQQQEIFEAALEQSSLYADDPVLIVAGEGWSHGIVGIVAAKLVEEFARPAFVLQIEEGVAKGSARSFGDFHLAKAIAQNKEHIEKGGGHAYAAGVTLAADKVDSFRQAINKTYSELSLKDQEKHLRTKADVELSDLSGVSDKLLTMLASLEPYGAEHEKPRFLIDGVVKDWRPVGADGKHAKVTISDKNGLSFDAIGFNLASKIPDVGSRIKPIFSPEYNEFRGRKSIQLMLHDIAD